MENMVKKIKIFIGILFVILISIIAFVGIFKQENGVWKNILPNYQLGMDIEGARELRYTVDNTEEQKYVYVDENGNIMGEVWKDGKATTAEEESSSANEEGQAEETPEQASVAEESNDIPYSKETRTIKATPDDKLTKENFEMSKKIIQERLKKQKIAEYNLRIDDVTGQLMIETENSNDNVELVEGLVSQVGKFQIVDYQNGLVLMDNSDIKQVSVVSSNDSSYSTYLQIEFNKKGAEKLKEISTKYVETEKNDSEANDENTAETEAEDETDEENDEKEVKYVSIIFDGTTMMTTYFGEEMANGMLQISVGESTTDYDKYIENCNSAQTIADILNSGILPIKYSLETDNFVKSEITTETLKNIIIAVGIAIAIVSVILIVRFKKNGFIGAILGIGYIAMLSIIVRYTNVAITENSMIAVILMIILNYIFLKGILQKNGQADNEFLKSFYLATIPVWIIAIVFTLTKITVISSIGMVAFWGMILSVLYNFIFTKTILKK